MSILVSRQFGFGDYNCDDEDGNSCSSAWNRWVRWLVLGLIVAAAILLFFMFSCLSARRRRRGGIAPYRGTGWTLGMTPAGHAPATYNNAQPQFENQQQQPYYNNSNNPPPAYAPPPNTNYYGNDVELQQPQNAYAGYGHEEQYAPPKYPPAGVKDEDVVR